MNRREFIALLAAAKLPANQNVKWALSSALWNQFRPWKFTDILDVMKDTGFTGMRVTSFPGILDKYGLTAAQMQKEFEKRNLHAVTISFNGPAQDPAQRQKVLADAKAAIEFLKNFGASNLVVFSPSRMKAGSDVEAGFKTMCECFNAIGELAGENGFTAGLHNHLNQMVEKPEEVHKCMAMTDPKLFKFSPDTAHLHLGGSNVVEMFERYKSRLMFMDYKDAKWTTPKEDLALDNGKLLPKDSEQAKFFSSIYDLGDGDVDFPGCHRILKSIDYKGWICIDLDAARKGPRASYERCGAYITSKLEPIYK